MPEVICLYSFLEHCLTFSSLVVGRILDASLSASASPDCSLKMAFVLTQVRFSFRVYSIV